MDQYPDVVVITGAGRGLGKETAFQFAALGIPTLCISKTENALLTAHEINKSWGHSEGMVMDISDLTIAEKSIRKWADSASNKKIGVVLTAAVLGSPGGIIEADLQEWLKTYQTNVLGNLAVLKGLLPTMLEVRYGRIVFLAGGGAAYGYPLFSGYACSKVAIVREVENLHMELKSKGDFLCTCLAPGAMETDMLQQVRAAGAEVRTTVDISQPVSFILEFMKTSDCGFSGRFVHTRDEWSKYLQPNSAEVEGEKWLLRRME